MSDTYLLDTYSLLIVDDDEVDRLAACRAIRQAGLNAEIAEASDCATALDLLGSRHFDCVFLDFQLPDGDGLTVLDAVRRQSIETPVVMLTGHGDEQIAVELMKAGASDYLAKGRLTADSLAQSLRYVTRMQRADRQARYLENEMQASRRLVQEMADSAPVLLWMSDTEGNITFLNRTWLEFTGRTLEQERGMGWQASVHPDDLSRVIADTSKARAERQNYVLEYRLRRADGRYRWILDSGTSRCAEDGAVLGYIGSGVDITERKEIEQSLLEKQSAIEKLNTRLEHAMFETHHRVKNNLQIIAAMIDMQIMDNPAMVATDELKQLAAHIHVLAVVHDLLTRQAHLEGQADRVSVQQVLGVLLPILQKSARPCELSFDIEDIELPTHQGTSLAIIANELIANAIKFGRSKVEIKLARDGNQIVLEVCDDGPGFPPGFDPSLSARMGLELVQSLSRLDLSGTTRYENDPEGGARVSVTVPPVA